MKTSDSDAVFDYRALRLLVGLIALILPVIVVLIASTSLSSISASYYTEARDVFVGALFIIGALLLAYNGHTSMEKWVSKGAAFASVFAAIFPTTCDLCEANIKSVIHYVAAVILFRRLRISAWDLFERTRKVKGGRKDAGPGSIWSVGGSSWDVCWAQALPKLRFPPQPGMPWRSHSWPN